MVNSEVLIKTESKNYGDDADSCGESSSADGTPIANKMIDIFTENIDLSHVLEALNAPNPLEKIARDLISSDARNGSSNKRYRRGNRKKVFDNGYLFTYDKDSSCGQRSFWRCERKSECPARVHTNPINNQVVKRIHDHNHEPPQPEELPAWIAGDADVINTSSTNALLPATAGMIKIENSEEQSKIEDNEGITARTTTPAAATADLELDVVEQTSCDAPKGTVAKRRRPNGHVVNDEDGAPEMNNEFWQLFDVTKRMMEWLSAATRNRSDPPVDASEECNSDVADFLDLHNFAELKNIFYKFTMRDMRMLTVDQISMALGNSINAVLLYNLLHTELEKELRIFVSDPVAKDEDEPVYYMLCLKERTESLSRGVGEFPGGEQENPEEIMRRRAFATERSCHGPSCLVMDKRPSLRVIRPQDVL